MNRSHRIAYEFLPQSRFGQTLKSNLSWNTAANGQRNQMIDKGGYVYDLNRRGCIVRMTDDKGKCFNLK